ncbi:MAG: sensor domain-containing diguanylate cyclase [Mycobacteriales bacterium]
MPVGRLSRDALEAIFNHGRDGILFTVPDGEVLAANPEACKLLGMAEQEVCRLGRQGLADGSDARWAAAVADRARDGHVRAEVRFRRGDGSVVECELSSAIFTEASGETRACVMFRDISELVAAREQLRREAAVDVLTDLANRRGFLALAEHELRTADRDGSRLALLYLDVDRFKDINDLHGHAVGDAVLRAVADVLRQECRTSDVLARLGGDEFVVLVRERRSSDTLAAAQRIQVALARHQLDLEVPLAISIGTVQRQPGQSLEAMMALADEQMYARKGRRRPRAILLDLQDQDR